MNVYGVAPLEERLSDGYWQSRFTMARWRSLPGWHCCLPALEYTGSCRTWPSSAPRGSGFALPLALRRRKCFGWLRTRVCEQPSPVWRQHRGPPLLDVLGAKPYLINRLLAGQLSGVSATDPLTLLGTAVGLILVVCLAASAIPALRAVHIDPLRALRHNGSPELRPSDVSDMPPAAVMTGRGRGYILTQTGRAKAGFRVLGDLV